MFSDSPARPLSMTILWRADCNNCTICWGETTPSTCENDIPALGTLSSGDQFLHNITGIDFDRTYTYGVTCEGTMLSGSFRTPPEEPTAGSSTSTTKILAYGDSRDGDGTGLQLHNRLARQMLYSNESNWYGALALHTGKN